jgi:predicted DNA-binding transcriptional regulator YafY
MIDPSLSGGRRSLAGVNRTDRLYALVEQLRAVAPRPRSARWLAAHFEVSARTIERDIAALQQSGVPIYAEAGRSGGYVLDRSHSLPPLNFSPQQAAAIAVALAREGATPFGVAAQAALGKVLAAMSASDVEATRLLADRVRLVVHEEAEERPVPGVVADAIVASRVLAIDYEDKNGAVTRRRVEPGAFVVNGPHWYLLAHCRLRGEDRAFRLDRIRRALLTDEPAPVRRWADVASDIPGAVLRAPALA